MKNKTNKQNKLDLIQMRIKNANNLITILLNSNIFIFERDHYIFVREHAFVRNCKCSNYKQLRPYYNRAKKK